jgi:hypothetical protein
MSDKDEILAAIAGVNARIDDLTAHVDESVNAFAGITKVAFDPFIEQVKADLAEGQAELDTGERIPWREVLANLEADAQQRMTERDNQPPV